MAKEKKRGFFSWLGFGQKEQTPEKETEVQNEQPVVEEIVQAQEPVKASEQAVEEQPQAHTEAEAETFAADVVEVTEQVAESEKAQPEAEVVAQPEPVVEETPEPVAIEREELPLPEDVNAEEVSPEEWQAEAETVEIVEAAEEEAAKEEITDEELEAQALAAEAAEEAVMVVPPVEEQPVEEIAQEQEKPTKEGFFARLKRSLLKTKENLGSGFISLFRGKKIDDDLFEELEEQLLIADVGVVGVQVHVLVLRLEGDGEGVRAGGEDGFEAVGEAPVVPGAATAVRHYHCAEFLAVYADGAHGA